MSSQRGLHVSSPHLREWLACLCTITCTCTVCTNTCVNLYISALDDILQIVPFEQVSEISFINTLEAQNKKMEVLERYQVQEARLQELQGERQRKREEQQAKEEAAQERRRAIESERVAKLMEQELKRREQEAKIEHMKQERERAREDIAREKARCVCGGGGLSKIISEDVVIM